MRSARCSVERRWATSSVVRSAITSRSASWMASSVLGVDRAGGVVEDQDPGVVEQRPGQGDALALAAREASGPARRPRCRSRAAARR